MRPYYLPSYLQELAEDAVNDRKRSLFGYLKDNEGEYHKIEDVDLLRDRIVCNDGYWECYGWIIEKDSLYVE
jgi:hypothetical protein